MSKLSALILLVSLIVVVEFYKVSAAQVCLFPSLVLPGQAPMCATGLTLDASNNMCCQTVPDTPKSGAKKRGKRSGKNDRGVECLVAIKLDVTGTAQCPESYPYDSARQMCCGTPNKKAH